MTTSFVALMEKRSLIKAELMAYSSPGIGAWASPLAKSPIHPQRSKATTMNSNAALFISSLKQRSPGVPNSVWIVSPLVMRRLRIVTWESGRRHRACADQLHSIEKERTALAANEIDHAQLAVAGLSDASSVVKASGSTGLTR